MTNQITGTRLSRLSYVRFTTAVALLIALQMAGLDSPAIAQVTSSPIPSVESDGFEGDPWEPFNERVFWFNYNVFDRFVLKPLGTAWDTILPDPVQRSIRNALHNLGVVPRLSNSLLQLKFAGAGREVARFTINSTVGVAGLFDVAKDGFGIEQSDEDTGQTVGVYGIGPGPYLVLPFLPVMTVRDGLGLAADVAMSPLNYFIPAGATLGIYGTDAVNERSLNLSTFERVEESAIDLYGAIRDGYLQRREAAIKE
jgi:phospholipid-binding lipoprotein MlaA